MSKINLVSASAIVVAVACLGGCFHRSGRIGELVNLPPGLDSAATAKWVEAQRAACHGKLFLLLDEGGAVRDFDKAPITDKPPVARYYTALVGAQCNSR